VLKNKKGGLTTRLAYFWIFGLSDCMWFGKFWIATSGYALLAMTARLPFEKVCHGMDGIG